MEKDRANLVSNRISKINYKCVLCYILICIVYFLLQTKFLSDMWFDTDELDIMVGGMSISHGYQLYKDFLSQHMPFTYYLSAFFWTIGFNSVPLQRIAFYIFYSICWTVIVKRYGDVVDRKALIIFPIVFMSIIGTYEMGTVVLSEHLAAIGFVILLLEFMRFYNTHNVSTTSCVFISIAIVLTFGTIFIAAFGVAVVAISVVSCEIYWQIKNKEKKWLKAMFVKYRKLIIICSIPWIILTVYYKLTGNLRIFFESAYLLNRTIYPKYQDYGSDILPAVLAPVSFFARGILAIFETEEINYSIVVQWMILICVILYGIKLCINKKRMVAIVTILLLMESSTRGFFDYHGTQMVAIGSLISTIFLMELIDNIRYKYGAILIFVFLVSGYFADFTDIFNVSVKTEVPEISSCISKITDDDEAILMLTLANNNVAISANRAAIWDIAGCPWMYEGHAERIYSYLAEELPRVAVWNDNLNVWGYLETEYAAEIYPFMNANYTRYGEGTLYIRNDYYDEAVSILEDEK